MQSGAYSGEQIDKAGARELGSKVVSILGCALSNTQTACLRAKSLEEIFQAQKNSLGLIVTPTAGTAFLPHSFNTAFNDASASQKPLMIGTNADEWTLFTALDELEAGDLPDGEAAYFKNGGILQYVLRQLAA